MPLCPAGHDSTDADYCDLCGIRIDGPPCPRCGAPGLGLFCESCGYTATSGMGSAGTGSAGTGSAGTAPSPRVAWTAVVAASRAHYAAVMATAAVGASVVPFPDNCPERVFQLTGSRMRIGRRSVSREQAPEIDLTGPPADPGVSRLHAMLVAQPDGTWAVIDPGSENGTTVNNVEIETGQPVPLRDGDSLGIGAWTSITIIATGD